MSKDWKSLSEAVNREQDPQKLLELVEELNKALEELEKEFRRNQTTEDSRLIPFDSEPITPLCA